MKEEIDSTWVKGHGRSLNAEHQQSQGLFSGVDGERGEQLDSLGCVCQRKLALERTCPCDESVPRQMSSPHLEAIVLPTLRQSG